PGAGATMRTVINVKSGGKTPLSGIVHALLLLTVMLGAGPITEQIPLAVLAGILIKVGIDIIDWSFLKRAHKVSLKAAGLMYGVLLLTVFVDLITAVAAGAFVANLLTIKSLTDEQREHVQAIVSPADESLSTEEKELLRAVQGRVLLFRLSGPMSFGAAKTISQRMTIVNKFEVLLLDLADVPRVGVTASLAIENMVQEACAQHRPVFIVGAQGFVKQRLDALDVLDRIPPENILGDRLEALRRAHQSLLPPAVYGAANGAASSRLPANSLRSRENANERVEHEIVQNRPKEEALPKEAPKRETSTKDRSRGFPMEP
ncbi:MAG: SulP family inorganic anion transporter, partial [Cyanobacteria bacterium J06553_1]